VTWSFTLIFTIVLARYLTAALIGEYTLAYSIWTLMGVFITFGMDTLLTKEIARASSKTTELLSTSIVARTLLYLISWVAVAIYVYISNLSTTAIAILILLGAAQIFNQVFAATQAAIQGLELMQYISITGIVTRAINTIFGIAALLLGFGIYGIGAVALLAGVVGMAMQLVFLKRHHPIALRVNLPQLWSLLRSGLPYLISSLGLVAYGQVDVLIISSLLNSTQVGWYGLASRLFGTFMFFPVIFTTAVFPTLTRAYANAPDSLPKIIRKSFNWLVLFSIPIGMGLFTIATPLAILLYGVSFAEVGPVLGLLGLVIIPTYLNILLGQFLTSTDRQNAWTIVILVATVVTIPLDIILVPWCQATFGNGAIAGSLTFLITELAMAATGIWLMPRGSLGVANLRVAIQALLAGLVMVGATWWFRDLFIAIPVLVGAVVYVGLILLLRVVPHEDLQLFKQFAQNGLLRLRRRNDPVTIEGV
jgi:O-antigen/teichoic acid export membrane protein